MAGRIPNDQDFRTRLTPRQQEVAALVACGLTNAEIAQRLDISLDGAKWHVRELLSKLDLTSRDQIAAYWRAEHRPAARLKRALFTTLPLKWAAGAGVTVIGVIVGVAVIAVLTADGETPPAISAPPQNETPTAATGATATTTPPVTSGPTGTPAPATDQIVNGIPVGPSFQPQSNPACAESPPQGVTLEDAAPSPLMIDEITVPPLGQPGLAAAVQCGDTVISIEREYFVPDGRQTDPRVAGTPWEDVTRGAGIFIYRSATSEPGRNSAFPANSWSAINVNELPAALGGPVGPGLGRWELVIWDEATQIQTTIVAVNLTQEQLTYLAEQVIAR